MLLLEQVLHHRVVNILLEFREHVFGLIYKGIYCTALQLMNIFVDSPDEFLKRGGGKVSTLL